MDDFDIGDKVLACFTNSGYKRMFQGEIVGKTKNYWKVKSITSPYATEGEEPGRIFHIATWQSRIYSANNRILDKVS